MGPRTGLDGSFSLYYVSYTVQNDQLFYSVLRWFSPSSCRLVTAFELWGLQSSWKVNLDQTVEINNNILEWNDFKKNFAAIHVSGQIWTPNFKMQDLIMNYPIRDTTQFSKLWQTDTGGGEGMRQLWSVWGSRKKVWNKSTNSSISSARYSTWNCVRQDWRLQCEKTPCNRLRLVI